jgi:hypothetical protein
MTRTGDLLHGDYAIVRYTHSRSNDGDGLAQYRDHDGDGAGAHWAYIGTDWTDSPSQIVVVRRVQLAEVPV